MIRLSRPHVLRAVAVPAGVVALLLGMAGCSLFPGRGATPEESAFPSLAVPTASLRPIFPSGGPTPNVPPPLDVPDPIHGEPVHAAGEAVPFDDGTVTYVGTTRADGGWVATFSTSEASLDGASVTVLDAQGTSVALEPSLIALVRDGDRWRTAVFGEPSQPPAPDLRLTLVAGQQIIVFQLGPVS